MKILFRPIRSGLSESISDLKEFNTMEDFLAWLTTDLSFLYGEQIFVSNIKISYLSYDTRIDWHTYIVSCSRKATRHHISFPCGYISFKY